MDDVSRQALANAVGVVSAVYIALLMDLEQPYWAALSVLLISHVDRNMLFTKAVLRIAATLIGVFSGFFVALATEGLPIFQLLLLMLAASVGTYCRQRSPYGAGWLSGTVTFMLILLCAMQTPDELYSFAHYRGYEILIGVTMATIATWAFGPRAGESRFGLVFTASNVSVHEALYTALVAALGAGVIVILWSLFNLPQLTQVLISSLVIVDSDPLATRRKGGQRILGCIVGGVTGLLIVGIDAVHVWWWGATPISRRVHVLAIASRQIAERLYRHPVGNRTTGNHGWFGTAPQHHAAGGSSDRDHHRSKHHYRTGLGLQHAAHCQGKRGRESE